MIIVVMIMTGGNTEKKKYGIFILARELTNFSRLINEITGNFLDIGSAISA